MSKSYEMIKSCPTITRPKNTLWRIETVTLCTISLGKTHSEGYTTDVSATKSSKHVLLFTGMESV